MKEINYEKYGIYGLPKQCIVFNMIGTKREHLELFNKIKFQYKNYECYTNDVKNINKDNLDELENFKIIVIKVIDYE